MPGLIQKSGYIKSGGGGAGNYAQYIATREGVELTADDDRQSGIYMKYISERPRSHGLFSDGETTNLEDTMVEVEKHAGPVWTFVYSLKREDAARLGYDSAASWRSVLRAHQVELAQAMKIPVKDLCWCAAYHDEKHHPHVHMMVWSADPEEGYLTERGIQQMRSVLTNHIFRDELLSLYQKKDLSYQEVRESARTAMGRLIREMESNLCDSPIIAEKMEALAGMLMETKGRKVYGYLKKPVKEQVDGIVDELAKVPEVAECYEVWNHLRDELENYYKDRPRERLPLSQQKEFKAIKNLVIQEADRLRLGVFTFEDEGAADEVGEEEYAADFQTHWQMAQVYREVTSVLYEEGAAWAEMEWAVQRLEQLWDGGFTVAAHQVGKCWRDGLGVLPDDERAGVWFRRSAEAGNDFSQYALGKLLQGQKRMAQAVEWYQQAAEQGNNDAHYRLGKLYLQGEGVEKDVAKALRHLAAAAELGNQYAQYTLGKLYREGQEVKQDLELAFRLLCDSADQGHRYAQFLLDHFEQKQGSGLLLSATRLLHHMGQIFRENSVPPAAPTGHIVDRKLQARIREKKIAMGHRPDDHEEQQTWGGMTMKGM